MTTNSPNPVDGDVQAHQMPELSQEQRDYLLCFINDAFKSLSGVEPESTKKYDENLGELTKQVFQVSLAALKAEPVADVVTWNHPHEERRCAVQLRKFDLAPGNLYTTPPAQLLRPVELPQAFAYTIEGMEEYADGWWLRKDDVIEVLRQQGYEVKS